MVTKRKDIGQNSGAKLDKFVCEKELRHWTKKVRVRSKKGEKLGKKILPKKGAKLGKKKVRI